MRTIIAGSRTLDKEQHLADAMRGVDWDISVVVSGCASRGGDRLGEIWARLRGVPIVRYPARWDILGKRAGYYRNIEMANNADALVAIWDGKSRGTRHMIEVASARGLRIYVYTVSGGGDES